MKVLQLLPSLNIGGVERGVVELLRRLRARGIDSIVVAKGGVLAGRINDDGGRFVALDCGNKNPLVAGGVIRELRALIIKEQPDIVHLRSRVPAWMFYFARRNCDIRAKVVSTMHGIYSPGFYSGIMAKADAVICPSNAVWGYAREHYDVPVDKLHLIHRGVDFDYFDPDKIDNDFCDGFCDRYGLPRVGYRVGRGGNDDDGRPAGVLDSRLRGNDGGGVALLAARLTQLKGHSVFVRALVDNKNIKGLIVGGGSESRQKKLMQLAHRLGVADRLVFVGAQKNMREIYAIADITVSASVRPEAFGRTVAESLAMNTPVAACAHGGALDIVRDGVNGCLFEPGDAAGLAAAMKKGLLLTDGLRESVLPMSLDAMVDKTMAVYESLL